MKIAQQPSPNFDSRDGTAADMLILHYTGMKNGAAALQRLCDPSAKVSAHYLVHEDGRVLQLVDEANRAWHAGVACWAGASNINSRSIGIELVNPGHDYGYRPFSGAQIAALLNLCADIRSRHDIQSRHVLGHSDVAPLRKQDPGELFPWQKLAAQGLGVWPTDTESTIQDDTSALQKALQSAGYCLGTTDWSDDHLRQVVTAFQRHYRPEKIDGVADLETRQRLAGLLAALA